MIIIIINILMDKRLLYTPSEKLAADAVDELTC